MTGVYNIFKVLKGGINNFWTETFFGIGTGNGKVNPLLPGVTYLYPLKKSENLDIS